MDEATSHERNAGISKIQEYRLKRLVDDTGLYPGDPEYDKLCKKWWKDHNKEMEKLKRLPDNVESGTSDEKHNVKIQVQIQRNIQ